MVVSTTFQYNPAIQPRAFIALGCLAQAEVDDDLIYQILVALRGALSIFIDDDCRLIVSIVRCLCYIVTNLPLESRYFKTMFWVAMSLIQIGHTPIFQSALTLLQVVLKLLDDRECLAKEDIRTFLLKARAPIADVAYQLDAEVGVHFRSHFSFAIAANLMKGLKNPTTKTATTAVFMTLLEISGKNFSHGGSGKVASDTIGYLIPLLPVTEKLKELFWLVGVDYDPRNADSHQYGILEKFSLNDDTTAVLILAFMITILENSEYDNREQVFVYKFLAEAVKKIPQSFAVVYVYFK